MTFRDVTIKNFKRNVRDFFSYFICSTFAITIFFLYAALMFNESIRESATEGVIQLIFMLSLVALTLFSVFFIQYVHSSFIKARSKEFALYMSLGMNKGDLQKITVLENVIINTFSMIFGIVTGVIFSRLFQNVAIDLLELQGVSYSLSSKSFIVTIVVFLFIFVFSQSISSLRIGRMEIADLMKDSRKGEGGDRKNAGRLGAFGVVLFLLSVVLEAVIANHEKLYSNFPVIIFYVLLSFGGMYMMIAHLGALLITFFKGKTFYYLNILSLTEINRKFKQNKKVMFILTILSAMTLFLVAMPFSELRLAEKIIDRNKADIEFFSVEGIHSIEFSRLKQLLQNASDPLKAIQATQFLNLQVSLGGSKSDVLKMKPIISQAMYKELTGNSVQVKPGEAINIVTFWLPGTQGIEQGDSIEFTDGTEKFSYTIQASYHGDWFASPRSYPSSSGIIVSNEDYRAMKVKVGPAAIGSYYGIDFMSWKQTNGVVQQLKETLNATDTDERSASFKVLSKIEEFTAYKTSNSLFLFVTLLLGILFFIAGGMVLYFKKYTEMNATVIFFRKLYKIGISSREIQKIISVELLFTFFVPLILGSILGYCFIYLTTHVFVGSDVLGEFMKNTSIAVFIYFVFQLSFYFITKRKLSRQIKEKIHSFT